MRRGGLLCTAAHLPTAPTAPTAAPAVAAAAAAPLCHAVHQRPYVLRQQPLQQHRVAVVALHRHGAAPRVLAHRHRRRPPARLHAPQLAAAHDRERRGDAVVLLRRQRQAVERLGREGVRGDGRGRACTREGRSGSALAPVLALQLP
jgi:hypothetical protein